VDKGNDQLAFHHFLFQLVLIWATMADLLVFSAILSSSPSFVAAVGAAADRFVMEFVVDHWVICRGPLGNVEDQPPSSFLVFSWCYHRPFFSGTIFLICWLMKKTNLLF
jgi:hypothetical protein